MLNISSAQHKPIRCFNYTKYELTSRCIDGQEMGKVRSKTPCLLERAKEKEAGVLTIMKAKARHQSTPFGFDLDAINKDFKDTLGAFQHKHKWKTIEPHVHQCVGCTLTLHNPGPLPNVGLPQLSVQQGVPAKTGTEVVTGHPSTFYHKPETFEEVQRRYQLANQQKRIAWITSKRGNILLLLRDVDQS
jgi:hypothetical protein